jgi:proteasome accessory factor B
VADNPSRVERLLNLLACLLDTSVPLTQEELVREVAGYPESKTAYRRAFERDKETLRAMGVPIRVETPPFGDPNESGYRVDPDEYYLPDLHLDQNETAALNVALNAVSLGDAAGHGAIMKLGGRVVAGDDTAPLASLPLAPALASLFDAYRRRCEIEFSYRGRARTVQPWAIVSRSGHWYLVGHDRDRDAVRTFRADRIEGDAVPLDETDFEVPASFDARDYLRAEPWTWGNAEREDVDVLVEPDHVAALLDAASEATVVEEQPDGTVVRLPVSDRASFRTLILGFLEHATVLAPQDVRDEIVEWLEGIVA